MKTMQKFAALLAVLLIVLSGLPVFATPAGAFSETHSGSAAQDSGPTVRDSGPAFTAELTEDGIYGTLSDIPQNVQDIAVEYSMGGIVYYTAISWDLTGLSEGLTARRQLCLPADQHAVQAFLRKGINSLSVRLVLYFEDDFIETESITFSNHLNIPVPETPPPFTANVEFLEHSGYWLYGHFPDIPANVAYLQPMYSLDGQAYQPVDYPWDLIDLGTDEAFLKEMQETQACAGKTDEPLKSYLEKRLDRFYVRLQVTTDTGDVYNTQAAVIDRGAPQPLPADAAVFVNFAYTMFEPYASADGTPLDGQYQITVREGATQDDVKALLPDTLPVEITLMNKATKKFITSGIVECSVTWRELPSLHLAAGDALVLPNAAYRLSVPAGTELVTPNGRFLLPRELPVSSSKTSGRVQLLLNAVGPDTQPDAVLSDDTLRDYGTLCAAFRQKPSGATSIMAYSLTEPDGERTEIGELLTRRALNYNQWAELYGYVPLLTPDDSPYREYLEQQTDEASDDAPGLWIELVIEGGTFDGARVTLPWPGEYDLPPEIPDEGSEGNLGDVGSGGNVGDDNGSTGTGGQRPNLPSGSTQGPAEASTDSPAAAEAVLPAPVKAPSADVSSPATEPPVVTGAAPADNPMQPVVPAATASVPEPAGPEAPAVSAQPAQDTSPAPERSSGEARRSSVVPVALIVLCVLIVISTAHRAGWFSDMWKALAALRHKP